MLSTIELSAASVHVAEDVGFVSLNLSRSGSLTTPVSVLLSTEDDTAVASLGKNLRMGLTPS